MFCRIMELGYVCLCVFYHTSSYTPAYVKVRWHKVSLVIYIAENVLFWRHHDIYLPWWLESQLSLSLQKHTNDYWLVYICLLKVMSIGLRAFFWLITHTWGELSSWPKLQMQCAWCTVHIFMTFCILQACELFSWLSCKCDMYGTFLWLFTYCTNYPVCI